MDPSDQFEDRSELYNRLTNEGSSSEPTSARTRLQALGSGIVQRRYRMATESLDYQAVGLQSLSRSRTATSPLVNLVDQSNFLSKSVSFQEIPAALATRYIDETKIQQHVAQSRSCVIQQQKQGLYQSISESIAKLSKSTISIAYVIISLSVAMYWMTIMTGFIGIALSGSILFSASTSTCTEYPTF